MAEPLEPAARAPGSQVAQHPLGTAACALGALAVAASAIMLWTGTPLDTAPDYRILGPISGLATLLGAFSAAKEPGFAFPAVAVCLAAAALVLGWVVVLGAIALGTALVIGLLSYLL